MGKFQTFEKFLASQNIQVSIFGFLLNIAISILFAYLLSKVYIKYGRSLSNRRLFAENFILLTPTTMLIITLVKSSLALSLGLVGALSIVRFRAAIKEPEELSYLFICIAVGLGLGANQRIITILAFFVILLIILLRSRNRSADVDQEHLYFLVSGKVSTKITLDNIVSLIKEHSRFVNLKRMEETATDFEAFFQVEFHKIEDLAKLRKALLEHDSSIKLTLLDNSGVH